MIECGGETPISSVRVNAQLGWEKGKAHISGETGRETNRAISCNARRMAVDVEGELGKVLGGEGREKGLTASLFVRRLPKQ